MRLSDIVAVHLGSFPSKLRKEVEIRHGLLKRKKKEVQDDDDDHEVLVAATEARSYTSSVARIPQKNNLRPSIHLKKITTELHD